MWKVCEGRLYPTKDQHEKLSCMDFRIESEEGGRVRVMWACRGLGTLRELCSPAQGLSRWL